MNKPKAEDISGHTCSKEVYKQNNIDRENQPLEVK